MTPSMPAIPSVVPPPARGGEPPQPGNAPGTEDAEGFAHLLQHAQRPSKPGSEPHGKATKATGEGRPTRAVARDQEASADGVDRTASRDDTRAQDKTVRTDDEAEGHTVQRQAKPIDDATATVAPATPASDAIALARSTAIDAKSPALPEGARDAQTMSVVEGRATALRPGARNAGHDARGATVMSSSEMQSDDGIRDSATGTAPPLHAALERAASDGSAGATTPRTPSFEGRQGVEATAPTATPVAVALRDVNAAGTGATHEAAVPHAGLHTAIDDPSFGSALGHQVALWVRDGVQEARLQLHPAELGPVTVQIALDGQAAHVDFTAAVAATRDSIEQSLPALAAALRESGFTLAGGGVSSQTGQNGTNGDASRGGPAAPPGDRSHFDASIDNGASGAAPRRWARSLLDVYA